MEQQFRMGNDAQNEPSPAQSAPAEVWLEIFDHVPNSADLTGIASSCKRFRDLSIRARHRDLVWRTPEQVADDLPVWDTCLNMEPHVRSLVLGITQYRAGPGDIIDLDGSRSFGKLVGQPRFETYASPQLHAAVLGKLDRFANIASMTFTNMSIKDTHFKLIHSLLKLSELTIERCAFEARNVDQMDHTRLPIKDLTMLGVRRFRNYRDNLPNQPDDDISYPLSLCAAQGLKSLTIDSSADVFRGVFNAWDAHARGWTIPRTLEHIYVLKKRPPVSSENQQHPAQVGLAESTFPDTRLYHFCVQARSLKTIVTPIFVPNQTTIAPELLPPSLERFAAPLETAQLIAAVRDVQALGLIRCGVSAREGIIALANVAMYRSGLKMLLLDCKGWDYELVPAVAQLFKELRRLKIVFDGPGPTEDFLVALAPDHLVKLRELHTLELYELPRNGSYVPEHPMHLFDDSFESVEEELRNLIIPWNRYCPNLRKVQLHAGYVMTRGFEGAAWCIERVHCLESKEGLDF
ncbi:hypothetical protein BD311DRAFT_722769 [Dichomitus squalens]|uniref:F-box domain-containing protein n=1 Tax=Dichomitus squalens TaxID=114155 RepID=A0A4Q9ML62_9APHY|nr:hypothetical protein BD311DRAFT_722769 [Dichomitus squalens]